MPEIFVVVWEELSNVFVWNVIIEFSECVGQPLQWIDLDNLATLEQGVEDGVVLSSAVVLAEEVVFASNDRGTLMSFNGVIVYLVNTVVDIAP